MQPADIAVELRPRSTWEAIDLGLSMLQRWWRALLLPHAIVFGACAVLATAVAGALDRPWIAFAIVWWLKPLYDRVVLHVLSRAVFGELPGTRSVFRAAREWLGSGLAAYLLFRWWPDMARSFSLPVRQLEGSRGRAARERLALLGRRTRGSAVWLTVVCLHFELVLYWSLQLVVTMLIPAKALEGRGFFEALSGGQGWTWAHAAAYAGAVFLLEPFYVAGGFALYLNRRTLLEGWDLEVALRRLAERHAALAAAVLIAIGTLLAPAASYAEKEAKREIAEVLKAPEFPHEREVMQWMPRERPSPAAMTPPSFAFGESLARAARVLLWIVVAAALAFLAWQLYRALPRLALPARERYRPPESLFGMELAPQTLPADVAAAASALAAEGRLREALALLYRGALSQLVHRRGVQLLSSHTEIEVLRLAPPDSYRYLESLVDAWRACAYARRPPERSAVETLALGYRTL
ncbi:MAG TPA: hypothetical protein VE935_17070 [Burkholderiales bacterium]|nr:hypothetical protein [Burkholderiales bacterium]